MVFSCQNLRIFPKRNWCYSIIFGKAMATERKKSFSTEGGGFPGKRKRRETIMSSKNNNQINVPEAREAMDKFKMQAAQEVGVNLQSGYNGHLTSREAGSVGGQMVKNICPIRTVKYDRQSRTSIRHMQTVEYMVALIT